MISAHAPTIPLKMTALCRMDDFVSNYLCFLLSGGPPFGASTNTESSLENITGHHGRVLAQHRIAADAYASFHKLLAVFKLCVVVLWIARVQNQIDTEYAQVPEHRREYMPRIHPVTHHLTLSPSRDILLHLQADFGRRP